MRVKIPAWGPAGAVRATHGLKAQAGRHIREGLYQGGWTGYCGHRVPSMHGERYTRLLGLDNRRSVSPDIRPGSYPGCTDQKFGWLRNYPRPRGVAALGGRNGGTGAKSVLFR